MNVDLWRRPRKKPPCSHFSWTAVGLVAGLATGCASVSPEPLASETEAVLAQPPFADTAFDPRTKLSIDGTKPLSPQALGLLAVLANPDLKAARAKANVAEAQLFGAGLLPDPSINLGFDYRMSGPDPYNAFLGQIVYELAALRDRKAVLAGQRAAAQQVRLDLAWQEWQVAGQARLLGPYLRPRASIGL